MQNNLDGINMELYDRVRDIGRNMIIETLSKPMVYLRTINDYQVFDSLVKAVRDEQLQTQWNEIRERTKTRIYVADYRRRLKDKEKILNTSSDYFVEEIQSIKCGNRGIRKQMDALHDNIHKFERIEQEFGSLDNFITSGTPIEIADLLANSLKYKLNTLGLALAMEYLRNVGIDATKPDTHIRRVLGSKRLGYSQKEIVGEIEAIEIIDAMASETGYLPSRIDAILWLFCSDDNGMICTDNPHCDQCRLKGKQCNWHK